MQDHLLDADALMGSAIDAELYRLGREGGDPLGFAPISGEIEERMQDRLRPDSLRSEWRRSLDARGQRDGEVVRASFRSLARLYLDRATVEARNELVRRRTELELPPGGIAAAIARETSPAIRSELYSRWLAAEDALRPASQLLASQREEAARMAGADSLVDFLAAEHPTDPAELIQPFEGRAIAPLDEDVARAVVDRWLRAGLAAHRRDTAHVTAVQALVHLQDRVSEESIGHVVGWLGRAMGWDPDGGGPRPTRGTPDRAWPSSRVTSDGTAWLLSGSLAGPEALRQALAALASAVRGQFIASRCGTVAFRFTDPAFDVAVRTLYRRLLLVPSFRSEAGLDADPAIERELRLQEAVEPRLAWSYLVSAVEGSGPDDPAAEARVRRASGDGATPERRERIAESDPRAASELRGMVLGLLLEERLLLRWGRSWYGSKRARDWLLQMWEAEFGVTAEEMAAALDLGTIEPTPVVDACRPPRAG